MNNFTADGFGKIKSPDESVFLQLWISVRKDTQIPEFDAITNIKYELTGTYDEVNCDEIVEDLLEFGEVFVDDVLKLRKQDLFHRALKKAILDYFRNTGQEQRVNKATEDIICNCRHVSNHNIKEAIKKGHTSFEGVQMATGAATSCGSCENKVKEIISQPIKTDFGALK